MLVAVVYEDIKITLEIPDHLLFDGLPPEHVDIARSVIQVELEVLLKLETRILCGALSAGALLPMIIGMMQTKLAEAASEALVHLADVQHGQDPLDILMRYLHTKEGDSDSDSKIFRDFLDGLDLDSLGE